MTEQPKYSYDMPKPQGELPLLTNYVHHSNSLPPSHVINKSQYNGIFHATPQPDQARRPQPMPNISRISEQPPFVREDVNTTPIESQKVSLLLQILETLVK